ncbi:MAG: hypothetical protein ABSG31_01735 [Tepidisphaeraceae bacterium]
MTFKKAVKETPNLQNSWKPGLGALRSQDRPHIKAEDTHMLRGSVDVDTALKFTQPNASRWDFAIGYMHENRTLESVYWVETHTGSDDQINVVLKKLQWLKNWLRDDGRKLAAFEREIVWVASGSTSFTNGATQVKTLAVRGLRYSGKILRIPKQHPSPRAANEIRA